MFDFAGLGLGKVDTLVDVGAGVGTFLGPALDFYKPSRFLAIEMLPERVAYLRHRFGWPNVRAVAVGEEIGHEQILRTVSPDSSSLLTIDPRAQDWYQIAPHGMDQYTDAGDDEVVVAPLDQIVPAEWTVDLMKMDIQGYEGRAIRGGQETLKRTRALIVEMLVCHHYEEQSTPEEIHDALTALGFKPEKLLEDNWNGDIHLQQDRLYVNTNLLNLPRNG